MHEILAAAHTCLGDFSAARNNLSQLLTDSRIYVLPGDTPLRPADFIGLAPISPRPVAAGAPLISVIICARDAAPYINNALQSIQAQTYPNIEIIAIDDGSTDNTFNI
ncbi:glycosyltransferase family 2 protein [Bordetella pertussis]